MFSSTLTSKGQTTVPKEVREALGLKPGDKIRYLVVGDEVRIVKPRSLSELAGCLAKYYDGPAKTLEEMDAGIAEYLAEKHGIARRRSDDAAE